MIVIGELNKLEKVMTVGGWIEYKGEICINVHGKYSFVEFKCQDSKLWQPLANVFGCECVIKIKKSQDAIIAELVDVSKIQSMSILEDNIFSNIQKLSSVNIKID